MTGQVKTTWRSTCQQPTRVFSLVAFSIADTLSTVLITISESTAQSWQPLCPGRRDMRITTARANPTHPKPASRKSHHSSSGGNWRASPSVHRYTSTDALQSDLSEHTRERHTREGAAGPISGGGDCQPKAGRAGPGTVKVESGAQGYVSRLTLLRGSVYSMTW